MRRRRALRLAGGALGAPLAGCASRGGGRDTPAGRSPTPGGPTPANPEGYETNPTNGVEVPLVPIDDAIEWYRNDDALFADARGERQYRAAHITDAVLSPAPDGQDGDDPVESEPTDRRIVTYCGCPHHLSSLRASNLIASGYHRTYALDEGFRRWRSKGYPVSGSGVEETAHVYQIKGQVTGKLSVDDPHVWAWHDPSGQREAAPIGPDGGFALTLRFYDVSADSTIRLVAGQRERAAPLRDLASASVAL